MYFYKYHGAGNDFIIIDSRNDSNFAKSTNKHSLINNICHRRTGIGADGFIELKPSNISDFRMIYYNSDGQEGTMCGNGGRCIAAFAWEHGIAGKKMKFEAADGIHKAEILKNQYNITQVDLHIGDVSEIKINKESVIINTGSPHYIKFIEDLANTDVYNKGKEIRSSKAFSPKGINVNFIEPFDDHLFVRTFERGVENETLSCGTGVTASAIAAYIKGIKFKTNEYPVLTKGGKLFVRFEANIKMDSFTNIWLKGDATRVFEGKAIL